MKSGIAAALALASAVIVGPGAMAQQPEPLVGTFRITAGSCEDGAVTGSTFRMILPSGTADGPFVSNGDSACSDRSFTLLAPGSDGGLVTGTHQPEPDPPFDDSGNSLASRITAPTPFTGVAFSTSTNPTDPQTGIDVPPPSIVRGADGALSGDLRSFGASWNNQEFNQGAPKPDGELPGNTAAPAGTYDPSTGAFTLDWLSQIQGGPFDRFTGVWHLEGTFVPASAAAAAPGSASPTTGASVPARGSSGGGAAGSGSSSAPTAAVPVIPSPGAAPTASTAAPTTIGDDAGRGDEAAASSASTTLTDDGDDGRATWPIVLAVVLALGAAFAAVAARRAGRAA